MSAVDGSPGVAQLCDPSGGSSIAGRAFATPLDVLGIEAPQPLTDAAYKAVQHLHSTTFNFWGELYSATIPQAHRRRIGQFWTNEQNRRVDGDLVIAIPAASVSRRGLRRRQLYSSSPASSRNRNCTRTIRM